MLMRSAPARALVSWIAARSVQAPVAEAHTPLPGATSTASAVLSTVNVAANRGRAVTSKQTRARPARRTTRWNRMGTPLRNEIGPVTRAGGPLSVGVSAKTSRRRSSP